MKLVCISLCSIILVTAAGAFSAAAQEPKPITLPPPQTTGGKPMMEVFRDRRTVRDFKTDKLVPQDLANLLWAAFGINRPGTGHRTAPSAMNSQEVDLYVALREGVYSYEPKAHQLNPVLAEDVRPRTSGQPFATNAPVTLIFVADLSRLAKARPDTRRFYADFDTGCISQNVYLYCASAGLGTVVHDLDRTHLNNALRLTSDQQIILAQAVGYPLDLKSESTPQRSAQNP
jgi:nitroreductase